MIEATKWHLQLILGNVCKNTILFDSKQMQSNKSFSHLYMSLIEPG